MKRRKSTRPGFATTAHATRRAPGRPEPLPVFTAGGCMGDEDGPALSPPALAQADPAGPNPIPDPICATKCGGCWACLRKKYGPQYWTKGVTK